MYLNKRELTVFYNGNDAFQKQVVAYAKTHKIAVNFQDISKVNFSTNLLSYLISKLGNEVKVLINKSNEFYKDHLQGSEFTLREWGDILRNNPDLLHFPVAMYGDRVEIITHPISVALMAKHQLVKRV